MAIGRIERQNNFTSCIYKKAKRGATMAAPRSLCYACNSLATMLPLQHRSLLFPAAQF